VAAPIRIAIPELPIIATTMTLILTGEEELSMFAMMITTNQLDPTMSGHQAPDLQTLAVPLTVRQDLYIDQLKDRHGEGKKELYCLAV
jgi:hypothetical protein